MTDTAKSSATLFTPAVERATERAIAALDMAGLVEMVQELVRRPSITGSAEESSSQHWFAGELEKNFFQTDLWQFDLPTLLSDPDFPGLEAPREEGWGLVGKLGRRERSDPGAKRPY